MRPKNLRILLGLLQPIARVFVSWLGFDNGNLEIASIAKQVIGTLLLSALGLISYYDYATICEVLLLCKRVGLIVPARLDKPGHDIFSAGICFIQ